MAAFTMCQALSTAGPGAAGSSDWGDVHISQGQDCGIPQQNTVSLPWQIASPTAHRWALRALLALTIERSVSHQPFQPAHQYHLQQQKPATSCNLVEECLYSFLRYEEGTTELLQEGVLRSQARCWFCVYKHLLVGFLIKRDHPAPRLNKGTSTCKAQAAPVQWQAPHPGNRDWDLNLSFPVTDWTVPSPPPKKIPVLKS